VAFSPAKRHRSLKLTTENEQLTCNAVWKEALNTPGKASFC